MFHGHKTIQVNTKACIARFRPESCTFLTKVLYKGNLAICPRGHAFRKATEEVQERAPETPCRDPQLMLDVNVNVNVNVNMDVDVNVVVNVSVSVNGNVMRM